MSTRLFDLQGLVDVVGYQAFEEALEEVAEKYNGNIKALKEGLSPNNEGIFSMVADCIGNLHGYPEGSHVKHVNPAVLLARWAVDGVRRVDTLCEMLIEKFLEIKVSGSDGRSLVRLKERLVREKEEAEAREKEAATRSRIDEENARLKRVRAKKEALKAARGCAGRLEGAARRNYALTDLTYMIIKVNGVSKAQIVPDVARCREEDIDFIGAHFPINLGSLHKLAKEDLDRAKVFASVHDANQYLGIYGLKCKIIEE